MVNRANRGIRDDVSYKVVFGESMTASYAMICSSRLCGTATHGAHGNSFEQKRPQGQLPRYSRQLEPVRRILPPCGGCRTALPPYIRMKFEQNRLGLSVKSRWQTVSCGGEQMKCLVLLAGCGLGDGSCIEEVILTYVALDKYGCDYTPVAEDVSIQSVNHLTEQMAEKRNILIEAARIGRGRIKDIHEVDFAEYDALIIPGGIGLLNNYRDSNVIKACITHFISEKKPVAAMCAGIDFLRRFYGSNLLAHEMKELTAEKFCFDAENNVYYTPAFRKTNSSYTALLGIDSMIYALKQSQPLR